MDIQTRKIHFIQDFLRFANTNILDKFEEMLRSERKMAFEKEIRPMTLKQYEQRVDRAMEDIKNNRVRSARTLKKEYSGQTIVQQLTT